MATRILMLGLGSIGQRHARLLRQYFPDEVELVALRTGKGQEANHLGITEISSWEEVGDDFDVAMITNPTNLHIATAARCAEAGLHLFIEKPIGSSLDGLADLIRTVREKQLTAYVAYPLRFHAVVRELRTRLEAARPLHASLVCASSLPTWRPQQDHRKGYSASWEQGGGVFLDMSHELDMAAHLFGPVIEIQGRLSRVGGHTVDADDCADLLVQHSWGTTSIHLNSFSLEPRRVVEVDTTNGFLRGDLRGQTVTGRTGDDLILERFSTDADQMYLDQLSYFLANLGRPGLENNLAEASDLYAKMIDFREGSGPWIH